MTTPEINQADKDPSAEMGRRLGNRLMVTFDADPVGKTMWLDTLRMMAGVGTVDREEAGSAAVEKINRALAETGENAPSRELILGLLRDAAADDVSVWGRLSTARRKAGDEAAESFLNAMADAIHELYEVQAAKE